MDKIKTHILQAMIVLLVSIIILKVFVDIEPVINQRWVDIRLTCQEAAILFSKKMSQLKSR